MNLKCPSPTTLKGLDSFIRYVRASGYTVDQETINEQHQIYSSNDAPGYDITPLGERQRDECWIYMRLPRLCGEQAFDVGELGKQLNEWFRALSTEQKAERLKETGILDEDGILSSSYGGKGKPTRSSD